MNSRKYIGRLLSLLSLLMTPLALPAQPEESSATNYFLHLDGKSYLELPPYIFDSLTEATVEGWVKLVDQSDTDRFFDFGMYHHEMYVRAEAGVVTFLITGPDGARHRAPRTDSSDHSQKCLDSLCRRQRSPGNEAVFERNPSSHRRIHR
jgi:hypothetical protein